VESSAPLLTLLGKPGCHLCHVMADTVRRVLPGFQATLVERDVREDAAWAAYLTEIPVLLLEGRELARHRVTDDDLRRRLADAGLRGR
jgi:hypothetical protein